MRVIRTRRLALLPAWVEDKRVCGDVAIGYYLRGSGHARGEIEQALVDGAELLHAQIGV